MSTTLLLEGDDLEALLERARAEGGPDARIVRAEKVRHGGVLGFFAKERFEVALEVPRPGDAVRDAAPTVGTKGTSMSEAADTRPQTRPETETAMDRLTRRLTAAAEDPRVAAQEGILGLAERADAAELAASAATGSTPATSIPRTSTPNTSEDALDRALRRLLEQRDPEPAPSIHPSIQASVHPSPVHPSTHPSPVHPSTVRPEFTALLDQLRSTTTRPAPTRPAPVPAPPSVPVPARAPATVSATYGAPPVHAPVPPPPPAFTPAPAASPVAALPTQRGPLVERQTLGRTRPGLATRDRREDPQLAADRSALRGLGVPVGWTRQLRPGDRFSAVLRMLDRMPDVDIDPGTTVVAVVGPAASVQLEAHRTALDLATGPAPRPVVVVPGETGADRATALAEARLLGDVVVAIETDGEQGLPAAVEALQAVGAGAAIVVVSAAEPVERSQAVLDALGQVDGLAVEGTSRSAEPAAVLQLGLPVVRLDGIPVDRYTWAALLCAHLATVSEA